MGMLDLRREPSAGVALPGFGVVEVPFLGAEELEAMSFRNCSLFIVVGCRGLYDAGVTGVKTEECRSRGSIKQSAFKML